MARIAPEIFRKRLLIEGYFAGTVLDADAIRAYFLAIEATRDFFELTAWETTAF
jgi:hypothetical protein